MFRKTVLIILGIVIVAITVFVKAEINIWTAITSVPEFIHFFCSNFLPPNFKNIKAYIPLILQTIMIAVVGTYLSAMLAFLFGVLLSERTNSVCWIRTLVLILMSFLRNVPFLVWAAVLVYIFGIGNMVGLMALVLATLGFLSRSYAESLNEIPEAGLEALKASGASHMQILVHGIIPTFIPAWINWTLFSFEINIRVSAILGLVGAGGIGILIQTSIRLFKYNEACALILILVAMVLITELITNKLRSLIQ